MSNRMPVEQQEGTLEVVNLPPSFDTELLELYFSNKRRSGGGPLVSVEKRGDRVILVFEETEAAARVLRQEGHTLQSMVLRVRKPACKDQQRLLLRGIGPSTSEDVVELYVENMLGLNQDDYQLLFTPARDSVLIQLSQPLSEGFQSLSDNISHHSLNGASMTLEEIEQTDSVLVGNLHPGTSLDMLCLYFEGREGNHTVMDVTKVSESSAKVSFADYASVDLVLTQPHKLKGADLDIRPYFDILQPTRVSPSQSHPPSTAGDPPPSSQMPSVVSEEEVRLTDFISLPDRAKLDLFKLGDFQQEVQKISPDITIEVRHNGVHVEAADQQTFERVKDSLLEYFCQMSETHLTLEPEEAEFLNRTEVKQRLQMKLNQMPAVYVALDRNLVVTALSCTSAQLTCTFLRCQLAHTTIPMDSKYKSIFSSSEWVNFLEALPLSSVKVSAEAIDILTLKGMESEKHAVILDFLTSHIETEVVVCMEPGVLKYIQTHCHQIMVCMDQVSMVPLESIDVSGLKIYGRAVACSMAQEMLEDIISSITTKTFTVSAPGIARYLLEEECKTFLSDMEKMSQVCILVKQQQPWEPLAEQDIFQAACAQMSTRNFKRVSSVAVQNNPDAASELLENAKMVISAITDEAGTDQCASLDPLDLYLAEEDAALDASGANVLYTSEVNIMEDDEHSPKDLEEEAKLSLAIQYSIESCQQTLEDEEELQTALMLSNVDLDCPMDLLNEAINASLEEAVMAANTIQLHVFGPQDSNLLEVETAFKESISQKQMVEKLHQHTDVDMGEYNRKCLEAIERKHSVEIQVEGPIINISGFRKFVSEALCDMKLLVDRLFYSASDQEILKNVQWVFHNPVCKTTTPYSPDVMVFLENAWKVKMEKVDILLDNQLHIMNFRDMHEYNPATGESVAISRESINSAGVDNNQAENKHSQLTSLHGATKVDEDSNEFHLVRETFNKTIQEDRSKIRIVRVDKLLNQLLYDQYQLKRTSIKQDADDPEFEKTLYHGTREEIVKEICLHGFNRSFCGKNATLYGQGVYFAVNSALSLKDRYSPPNADGRKFVFMSKVLTGNYTKGCQTMKTAPLKKEGEMPFRYDSVADNVDNPEIFVIFNDTQAFPEYLITCEKIQP